MRRGLAVLLAAAMGCGGPDTPRSAGEPESDKSFHYDEEALSAAPEVTVGSIQEVGGTDPGEGNLYMVSGATLLPSGEVVVANRGTYQLRIYSPQGVLARTTGQRGGGPGEFEMLVGTWRSPSGQILAWDPSQRRMTVFDIDGEMDRVRTVQENFFNPPRVVGMTPEGFVLVHEHFQSPAEPDQFVDLPADYLYVSFDGEVRDTIATVPWRRVMRPSKMRGGVVLPRIFDASVEGAAGADGLYFGVASKPEITAYSLKGHRRWIAGWDAPLPTVGEDLVQQWVKERAGRDAGPEQRRPFEEWRDNVGAADRLPAFSQLIVASTGDLWIKPYRWPRSVEPLRWIILKSTGALAGTAVLPGDMRLLEVGEDYLLGLQLDAFESEHVYVVSLTHSLKDGDSRSEGVGGGVR